MAVTLDDLITPATAADFEAELYTLAEALDLPVTTWESGDPLRTMFAIMAQVFANQQTLQITLIRSGFLDTAETGWLTLLASLVYNVARIEATFASGTLTLDNAAGGIYSFAAGEAVFKNSTTGATYTNTSAFTLGALETGKAVDVTATVAGSTGNAAVGQVDALVTTLVGVSVTNALALAGTDEESDPALRVRCRLSLGALSPNGPAAAYEYVALTPELNGGISVTRAKKLPPPGDSTVTVVVASATGAITSGSDIAAIQAGIDANAVCSTATATVISATDHALALTIDLYVNAASGTSSGDWTTMVQSALVAWVASLPIGGIDIGSGGVVSYRAMIGLVEALSAYILEARVTPAADVALTSTEVATLITADVTVNVHSVSL